MAGSLASGLVAALLLVAAPFIPATESGVTGTVLCGFALGWAMLAVLSVRFTDQPQRWAAVPALVMGLGGLLLIGFGSSAQTVLNWVWPPVMLAVTVWMFVGVSRRLRSRGARWLLYPVIAVLALAAIGGGYQTVGAATDARAYDKVGARTERDPGGGVAASGHTAAVPNDRQRGQPSGQQPHDRIRDPAVEPGQGARKRCVSVTSGGHGCVDVRRAGTGPA